LAHDEAERPDFSLGAVVKLTGLTDHTIRAWERRYGAIRPARTPKGTRRYTPSEVARLRLLRAAVDAGHRIGDIAALADEALEARLSMVAEAPSLSSADVVRAALERLDPAEVERVLGLQLSLLGPVVFAREVVAPLLREAGDRWEAGSGTVAEEHLLSSVTRGLLGAVLRSAARVPEAPVILFSTPEGEPHEFGALVAAVVATAAGASVTYLGPQIPVAVVADAAERAGAHAVALSAVTLASDAVRAYLAGLRSRLRPATEIWLGGPAQVRAVDGVAPLDLVGLEQRIARARRLPPVRTTAR